MWQSPNQRVRALAVQKRRDRDRNRRPVHVKRIMAELKFVVPLLGGNPEMQTLQARIVLNDLSPKGTGMFLAEAVNVGQVVTLEIRDPHPISIQGKVIWCQHDAGSHVLSQQPFAYRVGLEFVFKSTEEQAAIKQFVEELARDFLYTHKVA